MDTFVQAAISALKSEKRALTTHEIIHISLEKGFLKTNGLTPHKTLNARLSEHLLDQTHKSVVMRTAPGEFALREWSDKIPEHVALRRKINPIEEDILVFKASEINQFIDNDGLNKRKLADLKKLVEISHTMKRSIAEENTAVVQLVSSFLITYKNQILTYRRSRRLPEERMHDAYCLNFGGHISYEDKLPLFGFKQKEFIDLAMRRELDEEVKFFPPPKILNFKGFLYDSSTEIGRQHIGIVFHVPVPHNNYIIGEKGFLLGDMFEEKKDINQKIKQFDSWSEMIFKEFKNGKWK